MRPDEARGFALFCHKDRSASPETFVYTGIGSAAAGVWTTLSVTFTLDSYNNVPGNTLQLQIQGSNTPYYFRNFTLTDLTPPSEFTVRFESEGTYIGALPESVPVKRGEEYVLPECTAKLPGYRFDGWMTGGRYFAAGSAFTPTADTVFNAVWLRTSVVFALRPEKKYSEVKTFSMTALGTAANPDNTAETVFRTENGVYIENTNGLLALQSGHTYRLSFDIRPDSSVNLALFCHKDKSASPESFIYMPLGSAQANAWTTVTKTFSPDVYNNVAGNTLQLQIQGANTPYYIRNIVLEDVPAHTVLYAAADGTITETVYLYGSNVTNYTTDAGLLGSSCYFVTIDGEKRVFSVDTPLAITGTQTLITAFEPQLPEITFKNSIRTTAPAGIRFAAFIPNAGHAEAEEYGFLVGRADLYEKAGIDPTSDLRVNDTVSNTDSETFHGTTASGFKFVGGRNYRNGAGGKTTFTDDGETPFGSYGETGYYFMAVVTGLEKEYTDGDITYTTRYRVPIASRPYVKIGGMYFYGDCHISSMENAAKRLIENPEASEEDLKMAQNILDNAEIVKNEEESAGADT